MRPPIPGELKLKESKCKHLFSSQFQTILHDYSNLNHSITTLQIKQSASLRCYNWAIITINQWHFIVILAKMFDSQFSSREPWRQRQRRPEKRGPRWYFFWPKGTSSCKIHLPSGDRSWGGAEGQSGPERGLEHHSRELCRPATQISPGESRSHCRVDH